MDIFNNTRLFSHFWGVIFTNELSYKEEGRRIPNILLFDWDGKPLAQLNLTNPALSFDIDFANGHLYTFDYKTDAFRNLKVVLQEQHVIQPIMVAGSGIVAIFLYANCNNRIIKNGKKKDICIIQQKSRSFHHQWPVLDLYMYCYISLFAGVSFYVL